MLFVPLCLPVPVCACVLYIHCPTVASYSPTLALIVLIAFSFFSFFNNYIATYQYLFMKINQVTLPILFGGYLLL
ncbi:hypothetical protein F4820DRAFT_69691 [Hypoxylon rubiginosum]|uniref:Uncharacterized protein n=1 Tax=Hypoxylon rubiginosum TaxID=110542 RepID=A0ACB9YQX0_9PEZI|nr:hypothetical protein F4820DRAFT_69691 [Hypoxylon rubiginosum]